MEDIDIPLGQPQSSIMGSGVPTVFVPPPVNNSNLATSMMTTSLPVTNNYNSNNNPLMQIRLNPYHRQRQQNMSSFDADTMRSLHEQGYTDGLIDALHETMRHTPLRIWIVDNSGSMKTSDGTKIATNPKTNMIQLISGCSRWTEMQQTIEYHAQLAANISAPTIFRLLNPPVRSSSSSSSSNMPLTQQFGIAIDSYDTVQNDLTITLQSIQQIEPSGVTPLTYHLQNIRESILPLVPQLRNDNNKIVIIVATDGLPSDEQGYTTNAVKQEFENALRSMEGLPIWFVIRLFTNEDDVVEFWNQIDKKLELSIEVIDDYSSEGKEINETNAWLNYGIPLHRIREIGYHSYIMDIIDEKKLTKQELYQYCQTLFGKNKQLPDPDIDWKGFLQQLTKVNNMEKKQFNTRTRKMEPWINMIAIISQYRSTNSGCGCIIL